MSYAERLHEYGHDANFTRKRANDGKPRVEIYEVPLVFEQDERYNKLTVRRIIGQNPGFTLSLNAGTHGGEDTSIMSVWEACLGMVENELQNGLG